MWKRSKSKKEVVHENEFNHEYQVELQKEIAENIVDTVTEEEFLSSLSKDVMELDVKEVEEVKPIVKKQKPFGTIKY